MTMDWAKPKDRYNLPELPAERIVDCIGIWFEEDESPGWWDPEGRAWKLARTSDGAWWKRRSSALDRDTA
jgi:hypothetical protein